MYNILIYGCEGYVGLKLGDDSYISVDSAVKAGIAMGKPFTIVKIIKWRAFEEGGD